MSAQFQHPMLPIATHDEDARQSFVRSFKIHLFADISPGTRKVYDGKVRPEFQRANNRDFETRKELFHSMLGNPYYQMFSSLKRTQQELMWESSATTTEREYAGLHEKAARVAAKTRKKGSLRLDPNLQVPRYNAMVDIHIQPGGYHTDCGPDDIFAGAWYDHAVYSYATGALGPKNDDMGRTVVKYVADNHHSLKPLRILDMGCAAGQSTLAYCDAFSGAEVYAIDVGAPMLRYAHARAEEMGAAVHFSQQSAEATDFPDGYFDLIVSHILLHETSRKAVPNILRESHRLLRRGGRMIHAEVPAFFKYNKDPFDQIALDWEAHYNGEPFMPRLFEMDLVDEAVAQGFGKAKVKDAFASSGQSEAEGQIGISWYLLDAER